MSGGGRKLSPAFSVASSSHQVGKTLKASKVQLSWKFVLPADAGTVGADVPLDKRTTKIDIRHSVLSGRIDILLNDELSHANMQRGESNWQIARKNDLSPILFDAQLRYKEHVIRVTVKNASEKEFQARHR
jgi:hypothetical protein